MKEIRKRSIGQLAVGYLLGILTAGLAMGGVALVREEQETVWVLIAVGIALLLAATGAGGAMWRLSAGRAPRAVAEPKKARRRVNFDLPTVTEYFENASDGVLPAPAPFYAELDPASSSRSGGAGAST